jgi:hypothetical protein
MWRRGKESGGGHTLDGVSRTVPEAVAVVARIVKRCNVLYCHGCRVLLSRDLSLFRVYSSQTKRDGARVVVLFTYIFTRESVQLEFKMLSSSKVFQLIFKAGLTFKIKTSYTVA